MLVYIIDIYDCLDYSLFISDFEQKEFKVLDYFYL